MAVKGPSGAPPCWCTGGCVLGRNGLEVRRCVCGCVGTHLLQRRLVLDVPHHGQHEGHGLAAACLGDADAVAAAHDDGQRLGLGARVNAGAAGVAS